MWCNQDPNLQLSPARKIVIFLIGAIESMLFGGAVFGWPQLVHVLKVEGIYSDLCGAPTTTATPSLHHQEEGVDGSLRSSVLAVPHNNSRCHGLNHTFVVSSSHKIGVEKCDLQDERFALIYTITISCYSIPGILIGYLLHHAGLRVTRISGGTMLAMGFLFLGMATKEQPHWLFPAMIFVALGGNQVRMSVMQFGDLFPAHRATAITMLTGMYAASAALFLIFQYTATMGIERSLVCWCLAAVSSLSVFLSFLMPVHHVPNDEQSSQLTKEAPSKELPLSSSLWSGSSMLHQLWFFVSLFAINNYQQSYNVWVTASSCSVSEAGLYAIIFSYSNLVTVFFGPIGGAFTDYMVRRAGRSTNNELDRRVKEVQASFCPLLVTSICCTIMYSCLLFFHPIAIYVSLAAMVIARPCVFAVSTAYIRIRFPADHFNRLLGIYGTVTSALLFLQYPHFKWAQHMYYAAHALIIAILMFTYLNPIHLLFKPLLRKAVAKRDQISENDLRSLTV
ncbi:equilibrative nucleobase transporter 1-like [Macrobrachium nipponense]|uniref:equilibrative nucleobase transporter 1-like n=1 Tax=Macrobrachium nipponense TaxID=159736 RepID=UPI0030C805D6